MDRETNVTSSFSSPLAIPIDGSSSPHAFDGNPLEAGSQLRGASS